MRKGSDLVKMVQRRHEDTALGEDSLERLLRELERRIAGVDNYMVMCSMAKSELDLLPTTHLRDTVDALRAALLRVDPDSRKRSNCPSTWPKE